jgi:ATP-dependent Lhr-like helicase
MDAERWPGLSVLYVCPLRSLLNNLHPRVEQYGQWLGSTVGSGTGTRPSVLGAAKPSSDPPCC